MDDEHFATCLANRADKITHKRVALGLVNADAVLDCDRHIHHIDHGLHAIGHQLWLGHQAGAKRSTLDPFAGAAAVEVDLVIAPLLAQLGTVRQIRRVAATQLQGHGVLLRVETQVPRHITMDQRAGGHHLGVQQDVFTEQAVEVTAMPVGPIQHGGDG